MLNETHQIDNNGRDSEVQSQGWVSQMISGLSDYQDFIKRECITSIIDK